MLSAEAITDTNGMPLSIVGADQYYLAPVHSSAFNKHHPEHPDADPLLQGLGGRVVRHSRVQRMPVVVHQYYHDLDISPILPDSEFEQFRATLLGHGGYVAADVLDLTDPRSPRIRPVEPADIEKIHVRPEVGNIGKDGQWDARRKTAEFLGRYLTKQDLSHEKGRVRRFLNTEPSPEKLDLAWELIHAAAAVATSPITPVYEKAVRAGELAKVPQPKLTTIIFGVFRRGYVSDYIDELERNLAAAA